MTVVAAASVLSSPSLQAPPDERSVRLLQAARQFEAIFIRQMLAALEKTARISGSDRGAGTSVYGSMVVDVMADAVAAAGGLGLGEALVRDLNAGQSD
ncbi:MAG: rod-binding protein, partial [Polyangiaceae bacterium]|nr:rod-binding protein [Polyangiaceae bacterium]